MSKTELIQHTVATLRKLPQNKLIQISEFADFLLKGYEEETLQQGIQHLVSPSGAFALLEEEEELYGIEDLQEKF